MMTIPANAEHIPAIFWDVIGSSGSIMCDTTATTNGYTANRIDARPEGIVSSAQYNKKNGMQNEKIPKIANSLAFERSIDNFSPRTSMTMLRRIRANVNRNATPKNGGIY